MNQPPWKFRLIDEMEIAQNLLGSIFENPRAADKLERKLNWMIRFVREQSDGEWEQYLKAAEDSLSQPAKTYEKKVLQLELAREQIHQIINISIINGWQEGALASRERFWFMDGRKKISL